MAASSVVLQNSLHARRCASISGSVAPVSGPMCLELTMFKRLLVFFFLVLFLFLIFDFLIFDCGVASSITLTLSELPVVVCLFRERAP